MLVECRVGGLTFDASVPAERMTCLCTSCECILVITHSVDCPGTQDDSRARGQCSQFKRSDHDSSE